MNRGQRSRGLEIGARVIGTRFASTAPCGLFLPMEIKLNFKNSVFGIIASIVVVVGYGGYRYHLRSSLFTEGEAQALEYIKTDTTSQTARNVIASRRVSDLDGADRVEITSFTPRRLLPSDTADVRVTVNTKGGEKTYYLRFKRVLGSWKLRRETHGGLTF